MSSPHLGDTRIKQKFAFFPKKTSDGTAVWIEWYYAIEKFDYIYLALGPFRVSLCRWVEVYSMSIDELSDGEELIELKKIEDELHHRKD